MAVSMPDKRAQLGKIVENDPLIFTKSLAAQIQALIAPPFLPNYDDNPGSPIGSHQYQRPLIIIIDGLDERSGDNNQREVVKQIGSLANTDGIPFRFPISSRPEPRIAESFKRLSPKVYHLSLSDKDHIIEAEGDIRGYLYEKFEEIYCKRYEALSWMGWPWPSDEIVDGLVSKSAGMFIYAATVLKYIDDDDHHPANRLEEIIHVPLGSKPFAELDLLYQHIMSTCKDIPLLVNIFTLRLLGGRKKDALEDGFSIREIEFCHCSLAKVLLRSIARSARTCFGDNLHVFSSYGDRSIHLASRSKSNGILSPTDVTLQRLTRKLIEGHGDHIVKKGHRHILRCCLIIINQGCTTAHSETREYSYARKYWVKHLKHAPTGGLDILGAIHNLNLYNLRRGLTPEETTIINNWLRETRLIIEV
ncbi:hypothetical protein BDZ94DRAFT_237773 [Collybia nuda]|uniref:NACHT domain-containing protein n=1 Tax=Collybia nuda TaxID=64659 RepID=A0A9P5XX60_9AGAR|nr:hypothetical protein BDZ94DRAFT_237773 [Collybia nuda]